uniref:Uncharacterized protein n=1 Tax=Trypanosoma vivax (strain Y486) TaxID=1055687 RepID=G0U7F2_TRYVY|nr:conserved hypothetical protein [Trypanosoma vivax Y486]
MHIHETIPVLIIDPSAPTVPPVRRHIEDRTLYAYRNMGFALTHNHPALSGASQHPVVMENINQLRLYHSHNYVYHLLLRRTYNVRTFQTALGIIADSNEPFTDLNQLLDTRPFAYRHTAADRELMRDCCKQLDAPYSPPQHMRFDGLMASPQASAFVTSCDTLTEDFVNNFARTAYYTYQLYQHLTNTRFVSAWEQIYGPLKSNTLRAVLLYVGVGPQEFPETPIDAVAQRSLRELASRFTTRVEPPPAERIQELIAKSAWPAVRRHRVRLLVRWGMRYFMLRY